MTDSLGVPGALPREPSGRAGVLLLLALGAAVLLLPPFLPDPRAQPDLVAGVLLPPGWDHPLGTDHLSRDVFARLVYGGRVSLAVSLGAALLAVTLGAGVGLVAGYAGGRTDAVLMRVVDAALAVPRLILLLLVVALLERIPLWGLILAIGATGWLGTSRLVRAETMRLRTMEFVRAASALGAGHLRILLRHLAPNVAGPLVVATTLAAGDVMLLEAGLSYLGLGVQAPTPSWGNMIFDAKPYLVTAPWVAVAPGIAILLGVFAVNLVGESLGQRFGGHHR
ncbi:MAG: ABC transporter permease [Gemmatimonadota bacterium]|nr:ABC transporter permease [Gemmatimonadota bacterium]MDH5282847.1 ABC transporter permease [Gemmatimonadota bacterium]